MDVTDKVLVSRSVMGMWAGAATEALARMTTVFGQPEAIGEERLELSDDGELWIKLTVSFRTGDMGIELQLPRELWKLDPSKIN